MVQVEVNTTPVFWANKKAYDSGLYRVIANQGSTRSSKTYSVCQLLIDIASGGRNQITGLPYGPKEISVVSPSLPHIKKGARKDILKILEDQGIFNEDDFNRTDNIYHFPKTGSYIEFFGAEDSKRVRGPGRKILYVNEANLLGHPTYLQLALRTEEVIFIDFNPADEYNYVYEIADKPGNKLIISTYKNNWANLSKEQIAEIDALKDADENLWKVFGLGQRGTSSETIYTHWQTGEFPDDCEIVYGVDFGYNVPSAVIKIGFKENRIYAEEVLYETKLTTSDLIERLKDLGISSSDELFCDNAEPKTIEEMTRAGYNAKPAEKDVYAGIQKVKSMPLIISPGSSNLLKEIRSYKWKLNKDGKIHPDEVPVKFMDHALDALRYGVYTKLHRPSFEILVG